MKVVSRSENITAGWWRNDRHLARRPFLLARNRLTRRTRAFFEERDFTEVETAALQISPGNETHLHAFATEALTIDGKARPLYLHTSPEFACKSLLAAGETRIFNFGKVWRNRERGPLHHPEFTMLEWYRTNQAYEQLMADCADLVADLARSEGISQLEFRGITCDPFATPQRLSVADAFVQLAGFDLVPSLKADGSTDRDSLARAAAAAGLRVADDDAWTDIYSKALVERIEPRLGEGRLTLLDRYPVSEAALARPDPLDGRFSQRFELYACGVELANAFGELTDPVEQRRRFEADMAEKERLYGERYPIDDDFLAALSHMPPASGAALGFDRLVMLITRATRIDQVLWTPVP